MLEDKWMSNSEFANRVNDVVYRQINRKKENSITFVVYLWNIVVGLEGATINGLLNKRRKWQRNIDYCDD